MRRYRAGCSRGKGGEGGEGVGAGHLGAAADSYIGALFASYQAMATNPDNHVCTPQSKGATFCRRPTTTTTTMDATFRD